MEKMHLWKYATFAAHLRILWRLLTILKTNKKSVWNSVFLYVKKYVYFESVFNTLYIEIKHKC